MSRILLVDDSPHAQRMGERILSEEGYEVVAVSNADSALIRLDDADPDVVVADTVMPGRTGYDISQYIKMSPRHKHVRVILTAGVLESFDEAQARRVEADGTLKKPFEASALLAAVKPLAEAAAKDRESRPESARGSQPSGTGTASSAPFVTVVDAEQIRAAVTVALDAAMGAMVDEIARRVLIALENKKSDAGAVAVGPPERPTGASGLPPSAPAVPEPPQPALPPPAAPRIETVRRVSSLRYRSSSILGLDIDRLDAETEGPSPENRPPAAGPP
jgi:CheY-like chemotaxis protein